MSREHSSTARFARVAWGLVVLVVLIALAIAGLWYWWTVPMDRAADRSLLTDLPCPPPCWQGITCGVTSASQARQIIANSPYVLKRSIKEVTTNTGGSISWDWSNWHGKGPTVVLWENEVVYKIILGLSYDLTVGELVEKFGTPKAIKAGEGGIPEHPYWDLVLYYPGLGMRFLARVPWESHRLEPTNEVTLSTYFVPTSIEELLEDMYGSYEELREYIRPWKGYGDLFQIYYESPEDVF